MESVAVGWVETGDACEESFAAGWVGAWARKEREKRGTAREQTRTYTLRLRFNISSPNLGNMVIQIGRAGVGGV